MTSLVVLEGWRRVDAGGALASAPGAVAAGGGRIDVLIKGTDNGLWRIRFDGANWSDWDRHPTALIASDPFPVRLRSAQVEVFATDANRHLVRIRYDDSVWSDVETVRPEGVLASAPGAAADDSGRIDVFAQGLDERLWRVTFDGGWSTWSPHPRAKTAARPFPSTPSEVYLRGLDSHLWIARHDRATWTGEKQIEPTGAFDGSPGTVYAGPGWTTTVFVRGRDGHLWGLWYDGQQTGEWEREANGVISSDPFPVHTGNGHIEVFARGLDNRLWHITYAAPVIPG